ncbi:MAG: DUF4197 domain-containing protein [Bacteroidota bacterium]|jgi:hypothetical protein
MKSSLLLFIGLSFLSVSFSQTFKSDDIAKGLKEALQLGTTRGIDILSKPDGFFGNAAIKILMPPEAAKIEKSLRSLGFNQQVDDAILSMNRAAEDASKEAIPIFTKAIQEMSIDDAFGILKGSDDAATKYLQTKTLDSLTKKFRPSIETSLNKVNATKNWNSIVTQYNKFSFKKINPDLAAYVTERSLNGIYLQIAAEEAKIRKDPIARSSDLLKKLFGK